MQKKFDIEIAVGMFVLIGLLCLGYLSIRLGKLEVIGAGGYTVYAEFNNAGGIKPGSSIEIAGVEIGKVKSIRLNNYAAMAEFFINKDVHIQDDAIVQIKTKGLIGEKYVQITPGGSDNFVRNGGRLTETQSPIDIEELISKYVFGKV
jgi:phospholipid/cholesterol/gamma-HCH transport system substrate-binding protein